MLIALQPPEQSSKSPQGPHLIPTVAYRPVCFAPRRSPEGPLGRWSGAGMVVSACQAAAPLNDKRADQLLPDRAPPVLPLGIPWQAQEAGDRDLSTSSAAAMAA